MDGACASVADDDDVAGTGGNCHKGYCVWCVCLSACLPDILANDGMVNQNAFKINKVLILLLMIYNAKNNFA